MTGDVCQCRLLAHTPTLISDVCCPAAPLITAVCFSRHTQITPSPHPRQRHSLIGLVLLLQSMFGCSLRANMQASPSSCGPIRPNRSIVDSAKPAVIPHGSHHFSLNSIDILNHIIEIICQFTNITSKIVNGVNVCVVACTLIKIEREQRTEGEEE